MSWSLLYFDVCMRACARLFVWLLDAVVSDDSESSLTSLWFPAVVTVVFFAGMRLYLWLRQHSVAVASAGWGDCHWWPAAFSHQSKEAGYGYGRVNVSDWDLDRDGDVDNVHDAALVDDVADSLARQQMIDLVSIDRLSRNVILKGHGRPPPTSSPPLSAHVHPVISFEDLRDETDDLGTYLTVYSELESASTAETYTTLSDCDIEALIAAPAAPAASSRVSFAPSAAKYTYVLDHEP
jgi:hypothetical protein